jgi:hypothetical protein
MVFWAICVALGIASLAAAQESAMTVPNANPVFVGKPAPSFKGELATGVSSHSTLCS